MTKSRGILPPRRPWSDAELAMLRELYATVRAADIAARLPGRTTQQVLNKAWSLGLKKSPATIAALSREAMLNPDHPGRLHQFKPGQEVWNKGMKGLDIGGKATRFKKGNKPHTWNPIGHERITDDGYLQRKVADTGVTRRDYVNMHWLVWFDDGREIPIGHALTFKDGNKQHIALDNLELVTRAELMRRNSYHANYPKEVALAIQLRGALNRKINARSKKHEQQDHC